jgi:hypothetical protein
MVTGSCLCGTVRYEIDPTEIVAGINCYCANCRKASGAQMGTFFHVRRDGFRWLSGESEIGAYESSPGNRRAFCKTCGSRVPWQGVFPTMIVPGGALDGDPGVKPHTVLYAASNPSWCTRDEATQSFDVLPPQAFWGDFMMRVYRR